MVVSLITNHCIVRAPGDINTINNTGISYIHRSLREYNRPRVVYYSEDIGKVGYRFTAVNGDLHRQLLKKGRTVSVDDFIAEVKDFINDIGILGGSVSSTD